METVVESIANETHDGQIANGKCKKKQREEKERRKWRKKKKKTKIAELKGGNPRDTPPDRGEAAEK
jgi:ketol-acid reductoisomerase